MITFDFEMHPNLPVHFKNLHTNAMHFIKSGSLWHRSQLLLRVRAECDANSHKSSAVDESQRMKVDSSAFDIENIGVKPVMHSLCCQGYEKVTF